MKTVTNSGLSGLFCISVLFLFIVVSFSSAVSAAEYYQPHREFGGETEYYLVRDGIAYRRYDDRLTEMGTYSPSTNTIVGPKGDTLVRFEGSSEQYKYPTSSGDVAYGGYDAAGTIGKTPDVMIKDEELAKQATSSPASSGTATGTTSGTSGSPPTISVTYGKDGKPKSYTINGKTVTPDKLTAEQKKIVDQFYKDAKMGQTTNKQVGLTGLSKTQDEAEQKLRSRGVDVTADTFKGMDAKQIKQKTDALLRAKSSMNVADWTANKDALSKLSLKEIDQRSKDLSHLNSFTGNPHEVWHSCKKQCQGLSLTVGDNGQLQYNMPSNDPNHPLKVNSAYEIVQARDPNNPKGEVEDLALKEGYDSDTGEQAVASVNAFCSDPLKGCTSTETYNIMIQDGTTVRDKRTGDIVTYKGQQYVDEKGNKFSKSEDCESKGKGSCHKEPAEVIKNDRAWLPTSWFGYVLGGGPATTTIRSISSMIPGGSVAGWVCKTHPNSKYCGFSNWLDEYFSATDLMARGFCDLGAAKYTGEGMGFSPGSNGVTTVNIQAVKTLVAPCSQVEESQKNACYQEFNLTRESYYTYRITGRVIPKDCDMRFNIELDKQELYLTDRELKKGDEIFDLTGANSIITTSPNAPINADKICIVFKDWSELDEACLLTDDGKICNKVMTSEDLIEENEVPDFGTPTDFEGVYTPGGEYTPVSYSSEAAGETSSSTTEGLKW